MDLVGCGEGKRRKGAEGGQSPGEDLLQRVTPRTKGFKETADFLSLLHRAFLSDEACCCTLLYQ